MFDAASEPVAALDLPAGLTVHDATAGAIWGVVTAALGVPYVVRIPVRTSLP